MWRWACKPNTVHSAIIFALPTYPQVPVYPPSWGSGGVPLIKKIFNANLILHTPGNRSQIRRFFSLVLCYLYWSKIKWCVIFLNCSICSLLFYIVCVSLVQEVRTQRHRWNRLQFVSFIAYGHAHVLLTTKIVSLYGEGYKLSVEGRQEKQRVLPFPLTIGPHVKGGGRGFGVKPQMYI